MAIDACCCVGSNGMYVQESGSNTPVLVLMGQSTLVAGKADIGCNNSGATASIKMSCTPGGPALAEVSYTLTCSSCKQ